MKTLKNLILTLLTLFTVNSFGQTTHNVTYNVTTEVDCEVGDILEFYGSAVGGYTVSINGNLEIGPISTGSAPFYIGQYTIVGGETGFLMDAGPDWTGTINVMVVDTNTNLGINDKVENKINLSVYPNPFVDFVNITVDKETNLMITTISGQVIYNDIIQEGNTQIDMTPFPTGIYLVVVGDNRLKVIKN